MNNTINLYSATVVSNKPRLTSDDEEDPDFGGASVFAYPHDAHLLLRLIGLLAALLPLAWELLQNVLRLHPRCVSWLQERSS